MKHGDIVRMKGCEVVTDASPRAARFKFKAPKGTTFVLVYLGIDKTDLVMNVENMMDTLGWVKKPALVLQCAYPKCTAIRSTQSSFCEDHKPSGLLKL